MRDRNKRDNIPLLLWERFVPLLPFVGATSNAHGCANVAGGQDARGDRREWLQRFALTAALVFAGPANGAVSVTDDEGHVVSLDKPATRVVSLAPSLTENMFSIGAGELLVGVSEYSDFPEAAKQLPRVSGFNRIDMEAVVSARPDLVLAWGTGNPREQVNQLRRLGLVVFVSEPRRLSDIGTTLQRLGVLTDHAPQAETAAAEYQNNLDRLRARYRDAAPVKVFFQIWHEPLMTIRDDHLISDVIHLCGGRSLFPDLLAVSTSVDVEAVIVRDPQVIMTHSVKGDQTPWREAWQKWRSVQAVKYDQFYVVPADVIARHSPRILEGVETICGALDQARGVYGLAR